MTATIKSLAADVETARATAAEATLQSQITALGSPVNGTVNNGGLWWSTSSGDWVNTLIGVANVDPTSALLAHGITLGQGGTIPPTESDAADFLAVVPFAMTLTGLYVTVKAAVSTTMAVQLRRSSDFGVTFTNVSGFVATFSIGARLASVLPTGVNVSSGDILNFSVSSGSGTNMLVTASGVAR